MTDINLELLDGASRAGLAFARRAEAAAGTIEAAIPAITDARDDALDQVGAAGTEQVESVTAAGSAFTGIASIGTSGPVALTKDASGRAVDRIETTGISRRGASTFHRATMDNATVTTASFSNATLSRANARSMRTSNATVLSNSLESIAPDIHFLPDYGQSWSIGTQSANLTQYQVYDDLMFSGGLVLITGTNISTACASLVPMVASSGEPPTAGAARMMRQLLEDDHGVSYGVDGWQALGVAAGQDSQTLPNLLKGGGAGCYTNLISLATAAKARADGLNKTILCRSVSWLHFAQGISQTVGGFVYTADAPGYVAGIHRLTADLNTDLKAALGQTESIYLLAFYPPTQMATSYPAATPTWFSQSWDVLETGTSNLVRVIAPSYCFDHIQALPGDGGGWNIHSTEVANIEKGAYRAYAEKRLSDGYTGPLTVAPIKAKRAGNRVRVFFQVPEGPLVFDRSYITSVAQEGFALKQSDRLTDIPITVKLCPGLNAVDITTVSGSVIPSDAVLHIAMDGTTDTFGRTAGPRCTLRDSQGDRVVFRGGGINRRLDNYCLPRSISLSALGA